MKVIEYHNLLVRQMSETELQAAILSLATPLGWSHYHTFNAYRSDFGWPDLVLCNPPQLIFVELKRQGGKLTLTQLEWKARLEESGQHYYVWRPSEWFSGEIEKILVKRKRGKV